MNTLDVKRHMTHEMNIVFGTLWFIDGLVFVGGCVRDIMMNAILNKELKPHDYDVASQTTPERLMALLDEHRIKYIPTGLTHGTITICVEYGNYKFNIEHTTFRNDIACDGRHAIVKHETDVVKDTERRDFTINAMVIGYDGMLCDYHDGLNDIMSKTIKFVGNPWKRVEEDYLRILRAVRFAVRFGFKIEPKSLQAIKDNANVMLGYVSVERVAQEIEKGLKGPNPGDYVKLLHETGLLAEIFPHYRDIDLLLQNPTFHPEGSVLNHIVECLNRAYMAGVTNPTHLWAIFMHDIGKRCTAKIKQGTSFYSFYGHDVEGIEIAKNISNELHLSNEIKHACMKACELHMDLHYAKTDSQKRKLALKLQKPEDLALMHAVLYADHSSDVFPVLPTVPTWKGMEVFEKYGLKRREDIGSKIAELRKFWVKTGKTELPLPGVKPNGYMVIMRGASGSGKSTKASKIKASNQRFVVCSADQYFVKDGIYNFNPALLPEAHAQCIALSNEVIKAGLWPIIDNTNLEDWNMAIYEELAANANYKVTYVICTGEFKNTHGVSQEVVDAQRILLNKNING